MKKWVEYCAAFLAVCMVLASLWLGLIVGCALDDQCFEENTGQSAQDPRFKRPE